MEAETEQSLELKSETNQEAVAFVTEGVHISSSNAYALFFGYREPTDLFSIPQVDLISQPDQQRFKKALKAAQSLPETSINMSINAIRADESEVHVHLLLSHSDYNGEACVRVEVLNDKIAKDKQALSKATLSTVLTPNPNKEAAEDNWVVVAKSVTKKYILGGQDIYALNNVSLNIEQGEFLALAGPSGSGKSTLLNLIGCIDTPTQGSISIDGHNIEDKTPDELAHIRANKIGFIFQTFNLLPVLSAWENVEYPLLQNASLSKAERKEKVQYYLEMVGLNKYMSNRPNELSGGQRQRVAIARALATSPSIVLADEPTANLDHKTGEDILKLMKSINENSSTTFIFSTHDSKVMEIAERVVMLQDGVIQS